MTHYFVWELRPDERAEPDWYEVGESDLWPCPKATLSPDGVLRYHGKITREMFARLLAAAGIN